MDYIAPSETPVKEPAKLQHDVADDSARNMVLVDQVGEEIPDIDKTVEKSLRRKLDRRIITLVFLAYLLAFLDRSNIGNAETAGMSKDLGFDDAHFQWLLTIFYIPYIIFEWLAIMWKIVPPNIWAAATIMTWGLASTLQAAAFNWSGLMACRWFLAMAEAAFAPGVPYLLSFFYRRHELGLRCGIFLSAAPLATTFAGALAYAITQSHTTLPAWRLLFLVEGLPTLALSLLALLLLPSSPSTATFLTPAERSVAHARSILQSGQSGPSRVGTFNFGEALSALSSPQTWIQPLMYFSCNVSFSSLPVFLPTILSQMGYSPITAQGLTAPPYFLSFLICIATTYLADRTQQRGLIIVVLSTVAGVGYILLATTLQVSIRYAGVFLAAGGVFPAIANTLPWVLNNQGTDSKRGVAIALLNMVGQCGPLLGTRMFPSTDGPRYVRGMGVCAGFMFFNVLLAVGLRGWFVRENRRLERNERERREEGMGEGEGAVNKAGVLQAQRPMGASEMEENWGYRYVL